MAQRLRRQVVGRKAEDFGERCFCVDYAEVAEYADVEEEWRGTFLGGLTRFEQDFVQGRRGEVDG